jgi:hypothetical protein
MARGKELQAAHTLYPSTHLLADSDGFPSASCSGNGVENLPLSFSHDVLGLVLGLVFLFISITVSSR